MSRRSSLPVGVYLTLVFVSGLLVGAFGMRLYVVTSVSARASIPRPTAEEYRHKLIKDMRRRLHLNSDQIVKINQVLDQTRVEFKAIHQKVDPEIKQLRQKQTAEIRALLTPQQQQEYDRWRAERDQPGH